MCAVCVLCAVSSVECRFIYIYNLYFVCIFIVIYELSVLYVQKKKSLFYFHMSIERFRVLVGSFNVVCCGCCSFLFSIVCISFLPNLTLRIRCDVLFIYLFLHDCQAISNTIRNGMKKNKCHCQGRCRRRRLPGWWQWLLICHRYCALTKATFDVFPWQAAGPAGNAMLLTHTHHKTAIVFAAVVVRVCLCDLLLRECYDLCAHPILFLIHIYLFTHKKTKKKMWRLWRRKRA